MEAQSKLSDGITQTHRCLRRKAPSVSQKDNSSAPSARQGETEVGVATQRGRNGEEGANESPAQGFE